jgi:hypothetical protein
LTGAGDEVLKICDELKEVSPEFDDAFDSVLRGVSGVVFTGLLLFTNVVEEDAAGTCNNFVNSSSGVVNFVQDNVVHFIPTNKGMILITQYWLTKMNVPVEVPNLDSSLNQKLTRSCCYINLASLTV